jgi:cytochrome c-type biogenesis protein CcmH
MKRACAAFALLLIACGGAWAVEPDEVLKDASLEARARAISAELRCLVCQNQSIDDSHAPLARDLRILVRQKLVEGESDEGVRAYLVERYGDFILLRPRLTAGTLLLWFGPFVVLIGAGALIWHNRRRDDDAKRMTLDEEEARRLAALLGKPRDTQA